MNDMNNLHILMIIIYSIIFIYFNITSIRWFSSINNNNICKCNNPYTNYKKINYLIYFSYFMNLFIICNSIYIIMNYNIGKVYYDNFIFIINCIRLFSFIILISFIYEILFYNNCVCNEYCNMRKFAIIQSIAEFIYLVISFTS